MSDDSLSDPDFDGGGVGAQEESDELPPNELEEEGEEQPEEEFGSEDSDEGYVYVNPKKKTTSLTTRIFGGDSSSFQQSLQQYNYQPKQSTPQPSNQQPPYPNQYRNPPQQQPYPPPSPQYHQQQPYNTSPYPPSYHPPSQPPQQPQYPYQQYPYNSQKQSPYFQAPPAQKPSYPYPSTSNPSTSNPYPPPYPSPSSSQPPSGFFGKFSTKPNANSPPTPQPNPDWVSMKPNFNPPHPAFKKLPPQQPAQFIHPQSAVYSQHQYQPFPSPQPLTQLSVSAQKPKRGRKKQEYNSDSDDYEDFIEPDQPKRVTRSSSMTLKFHQNTRNKESEEFEENLDNLEDLGYERNVARQALQKAGNFKEALKQLKLENKQEDPPSDNENGGRRRTRSAKTKAVTNLKRKKIDDDSDDSFGDEDMKFTFSDDDEDGDVLADIGEDGQPVIRKRDNAADLENLIQSCESKAKRMKLLIINSNFKDQVLKYTNSDIKLDEDTSTTDNTPKVFAFEPKPDVMAPHCRLTGYQLVGMNWLYLLHQENLNGILADEMGLGKTLQTIALITLLKEKGLYTSPSLIVVPASALAQWGNEIKKWSPTLKYEIYNGSVGERQVLQERFLRKSTDEGRVNPYDYDILLTTYQLIGGKGDRSFLKKIFFHYVVLDEAHNIKNQKSQRFQILFRLVSKRRLLLTGTPLQNNLEELWTLLTFLMPKEFTAMKLQNYKQVFAEFIKNDKKKRQKLSDKNLYIRRIKTILGPFILRRLKAHASLEIPEKITHIEICEMGEAQRSLYNRVFQKSKNIWANHKDFQSNKKSKQANLTIDEEILDLQSDLNLPDPKGNGGVIKMQTLINNILMQLRKTCNHPILQRTFYSEEDLEKVADVLLEIDPEYENERIEQVMKELKGLSDWEIHKICLKWPEDLGELQLTDEEMWESSTKLVVLRDLLGRFYKNNNRILIFSQMTKVLDFLEPFLDSLGYRYLRLDGSTEVGARQGLIDEFNTNVDIFVFLLSTTAGGVGINLTAADTVVFYDMAFNPQVDRQAEDRCHRLGQTKQVHVYRLICKESCEEAIFAMAQEKKQLNDIVLQEGDYQSNPSQSENLSKFLGDLFIQTSKKKTRKVSSSKAKAPTKTKKKETPQDSKKSSSKKASTKTAPSKPSKSKSTPSSTTPPTKKRSSSSTAPSKEKATKPKARPKSKEIVEVTPKTRKSTPRRKAKPEVEPTETNVVPTPKLTFKLKGTPPPSTDTDPKSAPPPKPLTLKIPKIMNTENLDQMDK